MNDKMVIFVLFLFILFLLGIVLYQQFAFRTGTQRKLREIHIQLKKILDAEGDESLMIFTENKEFMELAAQINRLLESSGRRERITGAMNWRPRECSPISPMI